MSQLFCFVFESYTLQTMGMAVMLDVVIGYVQSLQSQIEVIID